MEIIAKMLEILNFTNVVDIINNTLIVYLTIIPYLLLLLILIVVIKSLIKKWK